MKFLCSLLIRSLRVRLSNVKCSHAIVYGFYNVFLKYTFGKIMQHAPTMNNNLVSDSPISSYVFKVVLNSNKLVVFKHGNIFW